MTDPLRATLAEIAYDNGMVHRGTTEQAEVDEMKARLDAAYPPEEIVSLDAVLAQMTEEQRRTIAAGETSEQAAVWAEIGVTEEQAAKFDDMLNTAFDG